MNNSTQKISDKFYSGVWGLLGRFFKVPREAPTLPTAPGEEVDAIKPARGYLNRLKVEYFIGIAVSTLVIFGVAIGISVASFSSDYGWIVTIITFPAFGLLEISIAMLGFLAIHLRYDTMWYVMNNRSIRIRRGIWNIRETTITFENVQNVSIHQGPIQRIFGIANVTVETAGGGGAVDPTTGATNQHQGMIEGVADPHRIRELVMSRLKSSSSAGLGDEDTHRKRSSSQGGLSPNHLRLLREIRDAANDAAQQAQSA